MGEQEAREPTADKELRTFTKALLNDLRALEKMLVRDGALEKGRRRIGAEQEMFLVDKAFDPAPIAPELLEKVNDPRLVTELARFNLEANLSPLPFTGSCLRDMAAELREVLALAQAAAHELDSEIVLAGILPTLRKSHLGLDNMSPNPRYLALNKALTRLRGGAFRVLIEGLDELETTHENVMLEACNTSFQIHFQVGPDEFAKLYNVAQAVTAPVLAAAVNSPLLLGRRLWSETRVALFQHSVDTRSTGHQARATRPRVHFGDGWVKESVAELFREDIARFRTVMTTGSHENSLELLEAGQIPSLSALRLHNGTVYRWNRPCYGVHEGKAHLRIENRALPSGPTVDDEIANSAFFFGLMAAMVEEHQDITKVLNFDHVKDNFFAAARHGLRAQFRWTGGKTLTASQLILDELLPLARAGLNQAEVDAADSDHYLNILEERVKRDATGASWMLNSLASMGDRGTSDSRDRSLVRGMVEHQAIGRPVHEWPTCSFNEDEALWLQGCRTVGQLMSSDLFTVRPEDLVDLAASLMDWKHVRHVPVEDDEGKLVGVLSHRTMLRLVATGLSAGQTEPVSVQSVMSKDVITAKAELPVLEAMRLMREARVGCLPVVDDEGRLLGIVTEHDFLEVSARLLERHLGSPS